MVTTHASSPGLPSSPPNADSSAISKASSSAPRSSDLCHPNWHLQCQLYSFALARCRDLSFDWCQGYGRRGGVNSPAHSLSAGSPVPQTAAAALVCCLVGVKGQHSSVLQMVRVRANSLTLLPQDICGGIFPSSLPWHGRLGVAGSALLFSHSLRAGLPASPTPRWKAQLTFFCMCCGSQVSRSFFTYVTIGPALSPATWGNGWGRGHLSLIHASADGSQKRFFQ